MICNCYFVIITLKLDEGKGKGLVKFIDRFRLFFVFPLLDREFVWALWLFDWWLVIIRLGVTFVIILWLLFLEFVVVAKAFFGVRNNLISFVRVDFHHFIYWINTSTYTYLHIHMYMCICIYIFLALSYIHANIFIYTLTFNTYTYAFAWLYHKHF